MHLSQLYVSFYNKLATAPNVPYLHKKTIHITEEIHQDFNSNKKKYSFEKSNLLF